MPYNVKIDMALLNSPTHFLEALPKEASKVIPDRFFFTTQLEHRAYYTPLVSRSISYRFNLFPVAIERS